mgnify:CR=1 FL=1
METHRVLVFTKYFWPEGGGAELASNLIIKDILSTYFDTTVVTGTKNPEPRALRYARFVYWDALSSKYKPYTWLKTFLKSKEIQKLVEKADIAMYRAKSLGKNKTVVYEGGEENGAHQENRGDAIDREEIEM